MYIYVSRVGNFNILPLKKLHEEFEILNSMLEIVFQRQKYLKSYRNTAFSVAW